VVEEDAELLEPVRPEVQPPADRVRKRLRLVVVVEAGQVAPAPVAAQLDEPRPEHDAHDQPAEQPDDCRRRREPRERARVHQRTEEHGQEPGLEELDLPAVAVPVLPDVHEGHVERPEQQHQRHVREARDHHRGEPDADPRRDEQRPVRDPQPEEARDLEHGRTPRAEVLPESLQIVVRR
jgi:hypothetical protein